MSEERVERIPFDVDVSRIIDVLAKQIYQTPLALLRENVQNAFDAILLRRHETSDFAPEIVVTITPLEISVVDNGVGMTPADLRQHYWRAGSSGKNTPEARAAGVVGTFGIGAMANFGIAEELIVETESAATGERTRSSAQRATLSTANDCIEVTSLTTRSEPGTAVHARFGDTINVAEATQYISEFVRFVDVPVRVNGEVLSQHDLADEVPPPPDSREFVVKQLESRLAGTARGRLTGTGEVWVSIDDLTFDGEAVNGALVLRQGINAIRTFRSGFGLAVASAGSHYGFGGVANVAILEPTAGREALTTASLQVLQEAITALDALVSGDLANEPESTNSTSFMEWVRTHGHYELCGNLQIRLEPGARSISLRDVRTRSEQAPALVYAGSDRTIIESSATDDTPLLVLSLSNPRRQCEQQYLAQFCATDEITDAPTVLHEKPQEDWSIEEQAIAFRIAAILQSDYFLTADVALGDLSHGLPIVAVTTGEPVRLVLDPSAPTFGVIRELYTSDYVMFGSMVKDYVRNVVFPRVADLVPSSTRQGAQAFLQSIRRTRDVFEYEAEDLESFSKIWDEFVKGEIDMREAAQRSVHVVQQSVQVFGAAEARSIGEVVPDVTEVQALIGQQAIDPGPRPPILRTDVRTDAKLLTVNADEASLYGYHALVALSDRVREERGEFFLQPHATSVVWGGQKVLFVFEHHSGEFGLYYDLQASRVVSPASGGGPCPTATLVLGNKIFIPVPDELVAAFVPAAEERKRFEIHSDLLYTDHDSGGAVE
jgi:molecular chaperone HtpG